MAALPINSQLMINKEQLSMYICKCIFISICKKHAYMISDHHIMFRFSFGIPYGTKLCVYQKKTKANMVS